MPKMLSKYILSCCLGFLILANSWAQESTNMLSLISYLQELENTYNVTFSYVDKDLLSYTITPKNDKDLNAIIQHIAATTHLEIEKISDRYYAVYKSKYISVCGKVLDNFAQNTIGGASIEVLQTNKALVTSIDGDFSLENIPREALLRIRYLGYKPKIIRADSLLTSSDCPTILLSIAYEALEEVTVYDFLTSGLSKQQDGSISLNTGRFGILPGLIDPDVLQTAQALPGVKSIDETVSDINVRGGTNDQNLILWDDIKMYQSGHFFGLISAFNPYLTDQVAIIKNGTSAQYGDGVSSVISMQTKDSITDTFFGGAGFNLISGDVYGQMPLNDRMALQFSARRSTTDFFNTPTYNRFSKRAFEDSDIKKDQEPSAENPVQRDEDFYFYDFTAKYLYNISNKHKLRLSGISMRNSLSYMESSPQDSTTNVSNLQQFNVSFGGSLQSQWNSRFSSKINLYYTRYNLDAQNQKRENNQELTQKNEVYERAFKLITYYALSNQLLWQNGYQFNETGITNFTNVNLPVYRSNIKGVVHTHSIFSEALYTSIDRQLHARLGVRVNRIENLDTFSEYVVEPRLNISYSFLDDFNLEVQGEYKSQSTNQIIDLEQNFLGIEKRRWILSDNNTLPVTKSKQASVGVNYDKRNLYVGIEGFYKEVNGISTATQGFQNENQFNGEIGSYDIYGAEFLINKKTSTYSTWLSYAYNVNTYTFPNITPSEFPNNLDIAHTLTFAGIYTYQQFKLGIGINYRTGKPYTQPEEGENAVDTTSFPNRINYQTPNSSRLPNYLRADASANYNFNLSPKIKATLGASVVNILNRQNVLNTYYRLNDANEIETVESISLGITPNASFRLQF